VASRCFASRPVASRGVCRPSTDVHRRCCCRSLRRARSASRPRGLFTTSTARPSLALRACCIPLPVMGFAAFAPRVSSSTEAGEPDTRASSRRHLPLEEHPSVTAVPHHCGLPASTRLCAAEFTAWTASSACPPPRGFSPSHPARRCTLVARRTYDPILPGLISPSRFLLTRYRVRHVETSRPHTM